ncbi:alpha/beta hydrolase [Aureimonas mangrovi]|uniref:alpha/beta hydrolase n=1 Tax=Aureimonas mangrovi TaxID=2758041 RepID=UPI00163DBE5E|nr:alpha/beta hydrolase [Aureimonas mangrovi]
MRLARAREEGGRRWRPLAGLVTTSLFLSACAAGALNAITPRSGYSLTGDIAYGEGERRRYDLYVPDGVASDTPVVVFFHGGSWDSGSKDIYRFVGQSLTAYGFIVAVPEYRLYPEVVFPGFVEDGAAAVARIDATMREGGNGVPAGDHPLVLMGHSAGAEIAGLLAFDERYLRSTGYDPARLRGFVGLAGPYDFLPLTEERYKRVFPEATRDESQPINFVDGTEAPAFLVHGLADTTVDPENTRSMAGRIETAGGRVETRFYEGLDHIGPITSFATALRLGRPEIRAEVASFIRETSR